MYSIKKERKLKNLEEILRDSPQILAGRGTSEHQGTCLLKAISKCLFFN